MRASLKTTISGPVQDAAQRAVDGTGMPAAIVAIRAGGGQILGVSRHTAHAAGGQSAGRTVRARPGVHDHLGGRVAGGRAGVWRAVPGPLYPRNPVGGQAFANMPAEPKLGRQPPFKEVFAHACSTGFAALSNVLNLAEPTGTARCPASAGRVEAAAVGLYRIDAQPEGNLGSRALVTVGDGWVRVSPLDMALAAGVVGIRLLASALARRR